MEYKKDYKKPYKKKTSASKVEYKPKRGKLAPLMTEDLKKMQAYMSYHTILVVGLQGYSNI